MICNFLYYKLMHLNFETLYNIVVNQNQIKDRLKAFVWLLLDLKMVLCLRLVLSTICTEFNSSCASLHQFEFSIQISHSQQ